MCLAMCGPLLCVQRFSRLVPLACRQIRIRTAMGGRYAHRTHALTGNAVGGNAPR